MASWMEQSLTTVKLTKGLPNWAIIQHIYILYLRWPIIDHIEAYMGLANWAIIKHVILEMALLIEQS